MTDEPVRHEEVLRAVGHEHVQGTHASTFEVTTDDYLTPTGDCIVGIEADRAPAEFDEAFVAACRNADAEIVTGLSVDADAPAGSEGAAGNTATQRVVASGHPELSFESERSAVWRTSDYVDGRTVAVNADRAAADLDPALVSALAAGAELEVRIAVERSP